MLREQFGKPSGLVGRAAGWIMATRPSNTARNRWVVSLLDVQPADRCLEIGFGPGVAVAELAARASEGQVLGLDHSELMVRTATRRNQESVDAGRVDLRVGSVEDGVPFDPPFDVVLTVNSSIFWHDQGAVLDHLRGAMARGGRLAIAVQPRFPGATDEDAVRIAEANAALLAAAGFVDTQVQTLALRPTDAGCAVGVSR
jgi:SAM-dependent methyltransferase